MGELLGEKCAVAAVSINESTAEIAPDHIENAAELVREALFAMQHRGTEASGIAGMSESGELRHHRADGMVKDVYRQDDIDRLWSASAVGHNRYATSGSKCGKPQPVIDEAVGSAFAHNGNLPDTSVLQDHLALHNIRTSSLVDSEMMGLSLFQYIRQGYDIDEAAQLAYPLFRGAFSSVALHAPMRSTEQTTIAFRDAMGIRPLALGKIAGGYAVASETCGLDMIGATYERDVRPGEMIRMQGESISSTQLAEGQEKLDIFELVYFASPSSWLYGQRVNDVRYRSGVELAKQHPPIVDHENVVVIPVPETSIPAAEGYAAALNLRARRGIVKNQYSGRTFMQNSQQNRQEMLRRKHAPLEEVYAGRDVVLIDDSIVRLNTLPALVERMSAKARSVSVLLASPPVRFPDFYGIDTPSQDKLAAANLTIEQMRQRIPGCSYLGFLSLSGLITATGVQRDRFSLSCFTGEYPVDIGGRRREIRTPISMEAID